MKNRLVASFFLISMFLLSCKKSKDVTPTDSFNRKEMITFWADQIITPAYKDYDAKTKGLKQKVTSFSQSPSTVTLQAARKSWIEAYNSWQKVGMFQIGQAENISLLEFTNIYPTNISFLIQTIEKGNYDLKKSSTQDIQGFPAVEYLLYGVASDDNAIVDFYKNAQNEKTKKYLTDVTNKLASMANDVLINFQSARGEFIINSGSSATATVNKLVNDYLYYYEKHLRAGKVGIPAGVFSGNKNGKEAETPYTGKSKTLLLTGLDAMQNFFNGKSYDGSESGKSLKAYLDEVKAETKSGDKLSEVINTNFDASRTKIQALKESFKDQVSTDEGNKKLIEVYDALQKNVVIMKTIMMSKLNIKVDYVDADGD